VYFSSRCPMIEPGRDDRRRCATKTALFPD
jgi:hypothetical protein